MAGVTQRVKAIYAQHPQHLERELNKYLETMPDVLDEIRFDHGVTIYEGGEKLTLYTAFVLHHAIPQEPAYIPHWANRNRNYINLDEDDGVIDPGI